MRNSDTTARSISNTLYLVDEDSRALRCSNAMGLSRRQWAPGTCLSRTYQSSSMC